MFAVIHRETGIVSYLFDTEPVIDETGMSVPLRACDILPDTHQVVLVDSAPADGFIGGAYRYANAWELVDQSPVDAENERKLNLWRREAVVDMRQARLALLAAGKLADVDAAIAALPSPQREAVQIEWEYGTRVRRTSPLVINLMPALGIDDAEMDQLFQMAMTL
jgi:hypothetical protein